MKPLRLEMDAFGPFASTQLVDFRALGDSTFFLIHGPTGAGKTSVLDAMCVALYGKTTGAERTAAQMRSQFAAPSHPTVVTLDFAVGPDIYRVQRIPAQERPAARGGGLVKVQPDATLWRRTGLQDDAATGDVLETGTQAVTRRIEELLGFSVEQFRQVIMLPQGRFRELLSANSADRQQILEDLFAAELYGHFEVFLKGHKKAVESRVNELLVKIDEALTACDVETPEELEALLTEAEKEERLRGEEEQQAKKEAGRTQAALDEGRRVAALFESAAKTKEEAERAKEALSVAQAGAAPAACALTAERLRDPERKTQEDRIRGLEALRAKVDTLASTQTEHEGAVRTHAVFVTALEAADDRLALARETAERREREAEAARQAAQTAALELARVRPELSMLADRIASFRSLMKVEAARQRAEEEAAEARDRQTQAQRAVGTAAAVLAELERAWRETQAARLAARLVEGLPCPVCGSTEHPAPARVEEELTATEAVEEAKNHLQQLRDEESALRDALGKALTEVARLQASRDEIAKGLGSEATLAAGPLAEYVQALTEQRAQLEAQVANLTKTAEPPTSLEETLTQAREAVNTATVAKTEAETSLRQAAAALDRLSGVLQTRSAEIPEEFRKPGTLDRVLAEDREAAAVLIVALETAQQADQKAREALAAAEQGSGDAARRAGEAAEKVALLAAPDVAALQAAADHAGGARDEAVAAAEAARRQGEGLRKTRARLAGHSAQLKTASDEFSLVALLSDAANRTSLSFQRYVLSVFLGEVLVAATTRLLDMTRGRYRLHAATASTDGRKLGGLDLEVFDEFTGYDRPVGTLSGGEGFLASLALALGLADVVQSFSGGIRLDAVFIDEGFGTLDPESLDAALDTLLELRDYGRLVGVISHVPELRERIDCRLEITPTPRGSTARLVVPG